MDKKGFTLIELLAVIAIMALIAGITVPNIISMVDKGKKEDYVKEAKSVVAKAKLKYGRRKYMEGDEQVFHSCTKEEEGSTIECSCITALDAGISNDKDAFGNNYELTNSKVRVCEVNGLASYDIDLRSGEEGNGKCLSETDECSYIGIDHLVYEYVIDR